MDKAGLTKRQKEINLLAQRKLVFDKAGLTKRQKEIYDFLRVYHKANGIYPSVREICQGRVEGQQLMKERRGTSCVHEVLHALQNRGWIKIEPGQARAITIL